MSRNFIISKDSEDEQNCFDFCSSFAEYPLNTTLLENCNGKVINQFRYVTKMVYLRYLTFVFFHN